MIRIESRAVEADTRVRVPFPPEAGREVNRVVEAAAAIASPELRRLGVAAPGPFDYAAGLSRITHKLPGLYGVDLRHELVSALDLAEIYSPTRT